MWRTSHQKSPVRGLYDRSAIHSLLLQLTATRTEDTSHTAPTSLFSTVHALLLTLYPPTASEMAQPLDIHADMEKKLRM